MARGEDFFDRARGLWGRVVGNGEGHGGYGGQGRYSADRGMRHVDRGWADMGDRGFEPGRYADNDYSFMEWDRGAADLGNMRGGWSGGARGYDAGYGQGGDSRMGRPNLDLWGRMGRQDMRGAYVNRHGAGSGYQGGHYQRDLGMRGYGRDYRRGYGGDYGPGYDRGYRR